MHTIVIQINLIKIINNLLTGCADQYRKSTVISICLKGSFVIDTHMLAWPPGFKTSFRFLLFNFVRSTVRMLRAFYAEFYQIVFWF